MLFTRLYIIILVLFFFGCKNTNSKQKDKNAQLLFHNTYDNVESVGMHKCAACHVDQCDMLNND